MSVRNQFAAQTGDPVSALVLAAFVTLVVQNLDTYVLVMAIAVTIVVNKTANQVIIGSIKARGILESDKNKDRKKPIPSSLFFIAHRLFNQYKWNPEA